MDPIATPDVNVTDPIVVGLTMALTWVLGKFAPPFQDKLRHWLPLIALIFAVLLRAVLDAMESEVTLESLFRGLAAGGMAIASHQQVRQIVKSKAEEAPKE